VRKSGNSIVASLPPNLLEAAGIEVGDQVKIIADMETGEITIEKLI